jgi:hypothetical protein
MPPKFPDQAARQKAYLEKQRAQSRDLVSMIIARESIAYIDSLPFPNRGLAVDFIVHQVRQIRPQRGLTPRHKLEVVEDDQPA